VAVFPGQRHHHRGGALHGVHLHRPRPLQQPQVWVSSLVQSGVPLTLLTGVYQCVCVGGERGRERERERVKERESKREHGFVLCARALCACVHAREGVLRASGGKG
jgi:hypothetical protein